MSQEQPESQNAEVYVSGYRLVGGLGRGNTSRVYLAEKGDTGRAGSAPALRTGSRVALKVPLPETRSDQAAAERFANEVRLTLQFRHPHLVTGLDGTPFGPDAFLAMRHYADGTLARELAQGDLSLSTSLQILADVASGLAYLHAAGAVHQDVKTQNIYLEQKGDGAGFRAALGDFGSTYFQAQGGEVSGSPFYMAPEVYQGEMTGPPSDVYSFGILAHELLTGERPHRGETYESLMISHLTHFPSPLNVPGLPKGLARLLDASLNKRPVDRPLSALLRRSLLKSLGQADEVAGESLLLAPPGPSAHVSGSSVPGVPTGPRPTVGRHGPEVAASRPPAAPVRAASEPEKRSWNPFKKKR